MGVGVGVERVGEAVGAGAAVGVGVGDGGERGGVTGGVGDTSGAGGVATTVEGGSVVGDLSGVSGEQARETMSRARRAGIQSVRRGESNWREGIILLKGLFGYGEG